MSTHRFDVSGMTCRRCVRSISSAVTDVPGVRTVEVDVRHGTVRVTGDTAPDRVRAAIRQAGYRVADDEPSHFRMETTMSPTTPPPAIIDLITSGRLALHDKHRTDLGDGRTLSLTLLELAGHVTEPAHTHPGFEVLYTLSGQGHVTIDGEHRPLQPGHAVHVAEGATKAITNDTDNPLTVLAILVLDSSRPPFVLARVAG